MSLDDRLHLSYVREKFGGARLAILDTDRPLRERIYTAYARNLSSLPPEWFPPDEGAEFSAILADLSRYGEAIEGEGGLRTTLWTMSDDEVDEIADRLLALANRLLAEL